MMAQSALISWANSAGSALSVIGHSLGGALAQWFAADFTSRGGKLTGVETFNSPGIAKTTSSSITVAASSFNGANCGYVIHHVTNGDVVSMFGSEYISGTVKLYTVTKNSLMEKHTAALSSMSLQKTITAAALSSNFFHYNSEFLNTIAALSSVSPALQAFAPFLFFRITAETSRTTLGKLLKVEALPTVPSIRVTVLKIQLGTWELKNVEIVWASNKFTGSAELYPGGKSPTFGVVLEFVDYAPYINSITAYMDANGGGIRLGTTPLYLQHFDATVNNIAIPANLTFTGNAELTIGPQVANKSSVTINGGITIDKNSLAIDGSIVVINDWFLKASGSFEYNWTQNYFRGNVNAKLLGGLATLSAAMKIWDNNGVQTIVMAGDARVQIPNYIPLIGGWGINAGVGVYVTANNNNSDDYVLVATSLDFFWKWKWTKDLGVKFYFDGNWKVIGASLKDLQRLKDLALSAPMPMVAGLPMNGMENPNLLSLDWGYTNENPLITFKLSDGRILTEAEMIDSGYIELVDELSFDRRRVYAVSEFSDIEIAQWEYTLDGDAAAITAELWGLEDELDVQANAITGGNGQPYYFNVNVLNGEVNASSDTVLTFYLSDANERDFNGVPVWTTTLGELQSSGWVLPENIAPGTYSIYVVAEDGNKVLAKSYFEEIIVIDQIVLNSPINLQAISVGKTTMQIEWNKTNETVDYSLQYRMVGDTDWISVLGTINSPQTVTDLTSGMQYEFQVKTISNYINYSNSEWSAIQTAWTLCNPPTNVSVVDRSTTSIQLNWEVITGAISYIVEQSLDGTNDWRTIATPSFNMLVQTDLIDNTTYYYRVTAVNPGGNSAVSQTIRVITDEYIVISIPSTLMVQEGCSAFFRAIDIFGENLTYWWDLSGTGNGTYVQLSKSFWVNVNTLGLATGTYVIPLFATNSRGNQSEIVSIALTIVATPANFNVAKTSFVDDQIIQIDIDGYFPGGWVPQSWMINWGDSSADYTNDAKTTSVTAIHRYQQNVNDTAYPITLTIVNSYDEMETYFLGNHVVPGSVVTPVESALPVLVSDGELFAQRHEGTEFLEEDLFIATDFSDSVTEATTGYSVADWFDPAFATITQSGWNSFTRFSWNEDNLLPINPNRLVDASLTDWFDDFASDEIADETIVLESIRWRQLETSKSKNNRFDTPFDYFDTLFEEWLV